MSDKIEALKEIRRHIVKALSEMEDIDELENEYTMLTSMVFKLYKLRENLINVELSNKQHEELYTGC